MSLWPLCSMLGLLKVLDTILIVISDYTCVLIFSLSLLVSLSVSMCILDCFTQYLLSG